jgi:hypothetical protein
MKPQAVIALAQLLSLGLIGCSSDVVNRVQGAQYTATLSKRNSGAMSRGSTLVGVRLNEVPDNSTHGQIVLGLYGDKAVAMQWKGPHELYLSCPSCQRQDVDFEAVKSGEITIRYSDGLDVSR